MQDNDSNHEQQSYSGGDDDPLLKTICVDRLKSNNHEEWKKYHAAARRPLSLFIARRVHNRDDAKETYQETWVRVYAKSGKLSSDYDDLVPWVIKFAKFIILERNKVIYDLKNPKTAQTQGHLISQFGISVNGESQYDLREWIERARFSLSESHRKFFDRFFLTDASTKKVSTLDPHEFGCSSYKTLLRKRLEVREAMREALRRTARPNHHK